jgi:ribosome-associated toxin RatA of RatAB toxin-antitoxin module
LSSCKLTIEFRLVLRRSMPRFLILAALLLALPVRAAVVEVRSHRESGAVVVSASVTVPADRAAAWSVLTDYRRYPEFVPDMEVSRVRGRDSRGLIVEQRGRARFLFLSQGIDATFAIVEVPERSVSSVAIGGSFRELAGRYELQPVAGGTLLSYSGRVVPGDDLPLWLLTLALEANVERHVAAFAREIARRAELDRLVQRPQARVAN